MEKLSKTRFYAFFLALAVLMILGVPRVSAGLFNQTFDASDIIFDTYINHNAPGGYINASGANQLIIGSNGAPLPIYRSYILWDISGSLPTGATISSIFFVYDGVTDGIDAEVVALTTDPRGRALNTVYWEIGNETVTYYTTAGFPVVGDDSIITLNSNASTDFSSQLAGGWFAIALRSTNEAVANPSQIDSEDAPGVTPAPTLIVNYNLPFQYVLSDTYYENGTLFVPPVNVTATGDGFSDEFNTSGGHVYGNANETEAFIWDIGGGFSRFIYGIGESENLTITIPDGTDFTYSFTIKDLTGNVGTNSFLEAYRTINGSETLITRMPIEQPNAVPMNLVFGKTYRMKIRFGDGSTFDWGFLIPGSDTTITLLVRLVEFGDGAQILYNYITVEATRTTGLIHIAYADARSNTVWANVSIRIRNGAVVQTYTRSNFTYAINYAGFNDSLGYIVTFTGHHSDFGVWGRTFILDQSFTFPDPPELDGIFGSVMVNFIPFMLTCITILVFPVSMQPIGLLGGGVMATMMSFIGWASWSAELLYFYWFIAILVNLVVRGRGN